MIKICYFLISFFIITSSYAEDINKVDLKDLDSILKQEKYNRLVKINNGKLEIDQTPEKVYNFSKDRYYTDITYQNTQSRELTNKSKIFLRKWLEAKYVQDNLDNSTNLNMVLINNQIDIYYKELVIVHNGKLYNFVIQKPLLDKLLATVKTNSKIQIELLYIGKDYSLGNNFFIITNFSDSTMEKKIVKENNFLMAKKMINNKQYSAALQRLNNFLKEYPNHLEAKKNVCLATYLNSLKLNNKKYTEDSIKCYEDLIKFYETGEIYYTLASIYYSSTISNQNTKYKKVLDYSNQAVRMFSSSKEKNELMYCGSLYLRGLSKKYFKDNDSLTDIETAQNICPEMISVNIFN